MRVDLLSLDSFYDNSLALDYLSGYAQVQPILRSCGAKFRTLVQRVGSDNSSFWERFYESLGDVVGFNTYVWNIEATINAAREIKRNRPDTVVVMGGMEAAYNAQSLLSEMPAVDFVIIGEGEIAFSDLLERLLLGEGVHGRIPGVAYRDATGNVVMGGTGPIVQNLDDIPSPFLDEQFPSRVLRDVLYESYRGCAFQCGFCLYHRDYTKQRYFSSARVAADIRALRDAGCCHLRFVDSTFNIHRGRVKEILSHLDGIAADVSVEVSAEFFDSETIEMFPRAGIRHVDIGLQSTNQGALSTVNREWYREDRFRKNLVYLRSHPALTLNVELIAGLPSDDYEGLKHSIDDAISLWPDHISIYRLLGLKGTEVEKHKDDLGLIFSDRPPYELIQSAGFPREVMEKVELLTFSHLILFNLGIARYAFKYLLELTSKKPTLVYEDFWKFVLVEGLYDQAEVLMLSRFYAYGNRFDRALPPGLEPVRIKAAVESFFLQSFTKSDELDQILLVKELMEYGLNLALLDFEEVNAKAMRQASSTERLRLAPWCKRRIFSKALSQEIRRQDDNLGEIPSDVAGVIFFVHPEFGPASLAIDRATDDLLGTFADGVGGTTGREIDASHLEFSHEEYQALERLQDLQVLIPA